MDGWTRVRAKDKRKQEVEGIKERMEASVPLGLRVVAEEKGVSWSQYEKLKVAEVAALLECSEAGVLEAMRGMASEGLRSKFCGQEHVFAWLDAGELTFGEAAAFREGLASTDVALAKGIWAAATKTVPPAVQSIAPLASSACEDDVRRSEWRRRGLTLIADGKAAALVMAGGQGSRLGYEGPKGCFELAKLPTRPSLFELFAKRLLRVASLSNQEEEANEKGQHPLFLVMTSELNDAETRNYFEAHDYFGLSKGLVHFFPQGTLPAVDLSASEKGLFKLHMEAKDRLATAPNGNGGVYSALKKSGKLDLLKEAGVDYVHLTSVDNALCLPCDPVFLGYCLEKEAKVASKVVAKQYATERVGVLALKNGAPTVVEYSELSTADAEKIDNDGKLTFRSGNICNHGLSLNFLKKAANADEKNLLPYHVARKNIKTPNENDGKVPNAIKLETFIFDAFTLEPDHSTLEVEREDHFAPVKNKDGADSPATAADALLQQGARWLRQAGATVHGDFGVEVSPEVSYAGEGLLSCCRGLTLDASKAPLLFTPQV